MRRFRFFGLLALAFTALLALGAAAGPRGFGPQCHHRFADDPAAAASFVAEEVADRADATDEQTAQIEEVLTGLFAELHDLRADRETLRLQTREALLAEDVDPAVLEGLRQRVLERVDAGSLAVTDALVELGGILDAEQRAELADDLERMHRRWNR